MAKGDKEEAPADRRVQWLEQRIINGLKAKPVETRKLIDNEESRGQITEFLDTADAQHLYVYQQSSGVLVARIDAPEELKKKGMYFSKKKRERISDEQHMRSNIVFGDLCPDALYGLNSLTRNVYAELIKREKRNVSQIPDVAVAELMEDTNGLLAHMLVTLGLSHGKTLLPLPPVQLPPRVGDGPFDSEFIYQLESSIIAWTMQIRAAIDSSPEDMIDCGSERGIHPGPLNEIAFWKSKVENLANLEEQLYSVKSLKILVILKKSRNSYYQPFSQLMNELKEASVEARDNYRFLKPIEEDFAAMCPASPGHLEFTQLASSGTFQKLFHYLYLLWTQSGYYNTSTRLVVLLRQMCNDLIAMAIEHVSVEEFAKGFEKKDAIARLAETLSICGQFKATYFHYKSLVASVAKPWNFQNSAFFSRLDVFLERCHDLMDIMETAVLFDKMENIKVGGTKSILHTREAEEIKAEFDVAYFKFYGVEYNLLEPDETRFEAEYCEIRDKIHELERRLGTILVTTIDDAKAISEVFKAVDTFDGFTDRTVVHMEWSKKQKAVLECFYNDLIEAQETFYSGESSAAYPNIPPLAAAVVRCTALLDRINDSHLRVSELSSTVLESDSGKETMDLYETLKSALKNAIREKYEAWCRDVGEISTEKLKLPLLEMDANNRLKVNFDNALVKTLREVYYLEVMNSFDSRDRQKLDVPPEVQSVFERREVYRSQTIMLEHVSTTYNSFMSSLRLEGERPLIQGELTAFEAVIRRGTTDVCWQDGKEVDAFIEVALKKVGAINRVVTSFHANVQQMVESLEEYRKSDKLLPLNRAEGGKTMSEHELRRAFDEHFRKRHHDITERGECIHALLNESFEAVNELKQSEGSEAISRECEVWQNYVSYVDSVLTKAINECIIHSLTCLRNQLDSEWLSENEGIPLVDVRLCISKAGHNTSVCSRYEPYIDCEKANEHTVRSIVTSYISNTEAGAELIKPLLSDRNYLTQVNNNPEIQRLRGEIDTLLRQNFEACEEYRRNFDEFKHLWEINRKVSFAAFLEKDQVSTMRSSLTDEDFTKDATPVSKEYFGVSLQDFDKAITEYERIGSRINTTEEKHVEGFVAIDVKPLRAALRDTCKKWKDMFSDYLMNKIRSNLEDLYAFMKEADAGLDVEVLDGNVESLKCVMRWIRDCRRMNKEVMGDDEDCETGGMFPPIQAAIRMLKSHANTSSSLDVELASIEELEELRKPAPEQWIALNKKALNVRAQNSIVQDREAEKVKERVLEFEESLQQEAP
ncbi:unnamed protein product [Trypanosoma congolense IL3000]|uniref:WGS project CAEQ00000000 data, annotated contig 1709 n=1 Tax=Trypanosoma congolense (strain IL3000) TaxID=1068625 RepID=F9W864_TRYCI|nr:unnamed protein product [Trypanosoma congolense IL3000]